jgi:hypothetical protein
MNIFKRFFGKKDIFFNLAVDAIEDPEGWNSEIEELVECLTEDEKKLLLGICKILHEHLEHHFDFWMKTNFSRKMFAEDVSVLFRSYFELLMIDWTVITVEFRKKKIRSEVEQTLWFVIHYSLEAYETTLYSNTTLKNYKVAFGDRSALYPKILTGFFSDNDSNKNVAFQNLYTLVIANPLTNDTGNLEKEQLGFSMINGMLDFGNWGENKVRTMIFINSFSKGLGHFSKKLKQLLVELK